MTKKFQNDPTELLLNGLVSYFKLEDSTDYFGVNNLVNNAGVVFQSGKISNAAKFDGVGSYLSGTPFDPSVNFYLSFWVYIPTVNEKGTFLSSFFNNVATKNFSVG